MLLPDEKLWANETIVTVRTGEGEGGGDAAVGAGGGAGGGVGASARSQLGSGVGGEGGGDERYRGTRHDTRRIFDKIEANAFGASGMRSRCDRRQGEIM